MAWEAVINASKTLLGTVCLIENFVHEPDAGLQLLDAHDTVASS